MDGHIFSYPYLLMLTLVFGSAISILIAYKMIKVVKHLHKGAVMLMALIPLISQIPLSPQANKSLDNTDQQQVNASDKEDDYIA